MSRQLEVLGEAFATAPQGIVVSKDDQALTAAIQKAVQELIDSGAYGRILTSWLVSASQVTTAELNPLGPLTSGASRRRRCPRPRRARPQRWPSPDPASMGSAAHEASRRSRSADGEPGSAV